jgi:predicted O-linked N-acetylglucosamine transferase (SPINDLY family)
MPSQGSEQAVLPPGLEHLRRGQALRAGGRQEEAVRELREACAVQPDLAEAHHQLGNALKSLCRYGEASASLREAARLEPGQAAIRLNLGVACLELRQIDEAVACFRRAIELEPARPEAHNILGHALLLGGRCSEARICLEEALRLRPGYPAALDNLGRVLKAQGRAAEAVALRREALAARPTPEIHSNLLYTLIYSPEAAPAEIAAEHRRWALAHEAPLRAARRPHDNDFAASRRLRVGYVSPDLVNHAVAYFLEPVLTAHERANFEITCYSDAPVADQVTQRLRRLADRWRNIAGWDDERVDALIRSDRIDILVDLAGHTARNRLLVFGRKPAPVQVSWLGYPNTTGLEAMDYRLTDAVSDPPGLTEPFHTEELARLPGNFLCYRPAPESPPVGPLPASVSGNVTFGCFNNLAKIHGGVIRLWARILREAKGARLVLASRGLADPATADRVRREFADLGVGPERIECDGGELPLVEHLRRYDRIDIALDAFPYNGTTTTCEALWMGVPVVTLAGRTHVSRVGASLLTHLGAPEWIAGDENAYSRICVNLASDLARLAGIRAGLRGRMSEGPLCDGPGFTTRFEAVLRELWVRRCAKASPRA